MKKTVVFGLVALALVVLISPGIVGYLAERSVDRQVEWAADENRELNITSTGFDRGWFSSAGTHRITFAATPQGRELRETLGFGDNATAPALIIETRLDHGIVPVTSMQREEGSLMPGLGQAESRISFAAGDGSITPLPGVVYTRIGLTGTTSSHYSAQPGSTDMFTWGATNIRVDSNARTRQLAAEGQLDSLEMHSGDDRLNATSVVFDGNMQRNVYDFFTGAIDLSIESVSRTTPTETIGFGPLRLHSVSELDDDEVNSRFSIDLQFRDVPDVGTLNWQLRGALQGLDAESLGRVVDGLDDSPQGADPALALAAVEDELKTLLAGGLLAHIEQFDVTLPEGTLAATLELNVKATDPDDFIWTALLLATEAHATITLPSALFEFVVNRNPDARALVAMGFLVPKGDGYELVAEYRQGLLTVNGAPMPIPMPSM